jgi:hypothetical protein
MIYLLTAWPISNSFITRTPAIPAAKAVPGLPQSVAACMFLLRSQSRTARIMGAWPCQARYLRSEIERICVSRPPAALNPPAPEGRDQSSAGRSAAGLDAARHRQHVAGDRLRKPIAATKSKSLADELARRPNLAAARETLAGVRRSGPREGWCYRHIQAIVLSIDRYAESASGVREFLGMDRPRLGRNPAP